MGRGDALNAEKRAAMPRGVAAGMVGAAFSEPSDLQPKVGAVCPQVLRALKCAGAGEEMHAALAATWPKYLCFAGRLHFGFGGEPLSGGLLLPLLRHFNCAVFQSIYSNCTHA